MSEKGTFVTSLSFLVIEILLLGPKIIYFRYYIFYLNFIYFSLKYTIFMY